MTIHSDTNQLRSFGLMVGGVFAAIGSWPLISDQYPRLWALILGGLLMLLGAALPRSLELPFKGWMFIGHILGWINTRILLSVVFYGLLTPMGWAMRLIGADLLRSGFEPKVDTYRVVKSARPSSHLKHQF